MGAISALGAVASLSAPTGFGQGCRNIPGPHKTYYTGHSHKMNANFNFSVKKRTLIAPWHRPPHASARAREGALSPYSHWRSPIDGPYSSAARSTTPASSAAVRPHPSQIIWQSDDDDDDDDQCTPLWYRHGNSTGAERRLANRHALEKLVVSNHTAYSCRNCLRA